LRFTSKQTDQPIGFVFGFHVWGVSKGGAAYFIPIINYVYLPDCYIFPKHK